MLSQSILPRTSPRGLRCPITLSLCGFTSTFQTRAIASRSSELIELFGSIDIIVNNAGVLSNDKINDTTLEEWRRWSA
jgi:NAD(P)-dependent dehydrogenase (short-subunit alcohol dehydrogenase family)